MEPADFDAQNWIIENLAEARDLTKATWDAVAALTILWNHFERTKCNRKACIAAFEEICVRAPEGEKLPEGLDAAWVFWRDRYVSGQEMTELFQDFAFADNHKKPEVQAILLKGDAATVQDRLFAIIVIIYRLRNNLFHGEKAIVALNDQRRNFVMASRALAAILTST